MVSSANTFDIQISSDEKVHPVYGSPYVFINLLYTLLASVFTFMKLIFTLRVCTSLSSLFMDLLPLHCPCISAHLYIYIGLPSIFTSAIKKTELNI
jgi:hypothetical protein